MGIAEQAANSGYTMVSTAGGLIPIEQWVRRDELGMKFDPSAGVVFGPSRPATDGEIEAWERANGMKMPTIAPVARDVFRLSRG